ncbi:lantibiotic dehydratase [Nonomuraea salmonea]|uniref:lantibiotic dehydratase n=1 Tax=Nonomuraea salmonea TaxID=46181 RepID=UPI003CD0ACE2
MVMGTARRAAVPPTRPLQIDDSRPPARWTLPPAVTTASAADWDAALDAWRTSTNPSPPDIVVITEHDRALPVDLRRTDDRALLRRYINRGGTAVTEESGGPTAVQGIVTGPAGPHALELVVPLTRAHTPPPLPRLLATSRRPDQGLHLPGGQWLSLVIRTPPQPARTRSSPASPPSTTMTADGSGCGTPTTPALTCESASTVTSNT